MNTAEPGSRKNRTESVPDLRQKSILCCSTFLVDSPSFSYCLTVYRPPDLYFRQSTLNSHVKVTEALKMDNARDNVEQLLSHNNILHCQK